MEDFPQHFAVETALNMGLLETDPSFYRTIYLGSYEGIFRYHPNMTRELGTFIIERLRTKQYCNRKQVELAKQYVLNVEEQALSFNEHNPPDLLILENLRKQLVQSWNQLP